MLNIKKLRKLYRKNININRYLRKNTNLAERKIIKISYDIQSGAYINRFNYKKTLNYIKPMIDEINKTDFKSLLDFGCGELTAFYTLTENIKTKKKSFFANDLSFSRIYAGMQFLKKKKKFLKLTCFSNNSYRLPLPDNSIDIITTVHAIEPNKRNALKILKELFRVAKKKLILIEPNDRLLKKISNKKKRSLIAKRFKEHNYVSNLESKIKSITKNYYITECKFQYNPKNPGTCFIIKKKISNSTNAKFLNPKNSKDVLKKNSNFYYSDKTGDMYPIIEETVIFNKNELYISSLK